MTRSRRVIAAFAVTAMLVGACGTAASQQPASSSTGGGGGATAAPGGGGDGGATVAPGGAGGGTSGEGAFGAASSALDQLDSYKFDVEINSSESSTIGSEGVTSLKGAVVHKPQEESLLDESVTDASGAITSESHYLIIGQDAWTKPTADGTYTTLPAVAVAGITAALDAFRPEKLFGADFGTLGSDYTMVGTETKNGVNCQHFQGGASIGTFFDALSGVQGSWQSDVWIAVDGGYLVSSNVQAQGATATSAGNFSIDVEITNVNDPSNVLTPPS
ncbi:MAG TPA: hypothetical protein VFW20_01175 [Candidatus Limnocylindrales bacterium]|nr:hypothetical protein [Candidatus Limnocylindrales bacterium]